jgi:hypothetical protein
MLLHDAQHTTQAIQADAVRTAAWARRYETAIAARQRQGTRRIVGRALINLGRLIAAEPTTAAAPVRIGR